MIRLIAMNMTRHKARTLATAIGIGIGVGTIVALLSVGAGLKRTAAELVHLGQADVGVFQAGVEDPTASVLPVSLAAELGRRPDVAGAAPMLLMVEAVPNSSAAVVFGMRPSDFVARRLVITSGRSELGGKKILVGDRLADELHLRLGSRIALKHRVFAVSGIYHSGIYFQGPGAAIDLASAQRIEHREDEATTIAVQFAGGVDQASAEKALQREFPNTNIIGAADDPSRIGANGELVQKAVELIAALALIVGGLGVSNTMAMAVLERERELALFNAVGWRRRRIASLILGEGVATSILGAGIGMLFGIVGADLLNRALGVSTVVSPQVTPMTIFEALLIGIAIGVLGGLYPAWRGVTVSPTRLLGG